MVAAEVNKRTEKGNHLDGQESGEKDKCSGRH